MNAQQTPAGKATTWELATIVKVANQTSHLAVLDMEHEKNGRPAIVCLLGDSQNVTHDDIRHAA